MLNHPRLTHGSLGMLKHNLQNPVNSKSSPIVRLYKWLTREFMFLRLGSHPHRPASDLVLTLKSEQDLEARIESMSFPSIIILDKYSWRRRWHKAQPWLWWKSWDFYLLFGWSPNYTCQNVATTLPMGWGCSKDDTILQITCTSWPSFTKQY